MSGGGGGRTDNRTTSQTDTLNQQLGLEDNSGQVITGDGNAVTIESKDFEVIDRGFAAVEALGIENALLATGTVNAAVDITAGANSLALDLVNTTSSTVENTVLENSAVTTNALNQVTDLAFDLTSKAESLFNTSISAVNTANAEALASNERVSFQSIDAINQANIRTTDAITQANNNVVDLSKSLTESAFLENRALSQEALLINERATKAAFDLVDNVTTDDSSQAAISQTKYVALAFVALGLGMVFRGFN